MPASVSCAWTWPTAPAWNELFADEGFDRVVHLAAQAGVRYSLVNPHAYIDSNVVGFMNVLEGCRHHRVQHLVYASSSSVYGGNTQMPFSEHHNVDHPVSMYAATKKANELMAHTYSHLFGLPTTGLRFFTVYGPWGRPDMALFLFTKAILEDRADRCVQSWPDGARLHLRRRHRRRRGARARSTRDGRPGFDPAQPDPARSNAPYRVFNIGNNSPVKLMDFIEAIEQALGRTARKNFLPLQDGDVPATYADVSELSAWTGFQPATPVRDGVAVSSHWYSNYFGA